MFEIAICDDDKNSLKELASIIEKYCSEKKIGYTIDQYNSGIDLLKSSKRYNLIFLDIQMDELNGIELARRIRLNDKHVKIIYVTNYLNYQTDAFTVRAFGYIIKPFSEKDIFQQINDVIEYSKQDETEITITFDTDQGIKTINLKDIFYFEAWSHKIKICCTNDIYITNSTIINILNNVKSYGFSMPHKSFVINMQYISKIKGYDIFLTNGMSIPISQKRAVEFKADFHQFLKNNFLLLRGLNNE